jgi:hypothetical protein
MWGCLINCAAWMRQMSITEMNGFSVTQVWMGAEHEPVELPVLLLRCHWYHTWAQTEITTVKLPSNLIVLYAC